MDAVELRFALRPLDAVTPWGEVENGAKLHWFGLTEGTYELRIGPHRLYCPVGAHHGVDYFVVRPWEDLMEVVRAVLDPVPEAVVTRLADYEGWCTWCDQLREREDLDDETIEVATGWSWERQLGAGHLRDAPVLQTWRDGEHIQLRWSSPPPSPDGPRWMSPSGAGSCTVDVFRSALLAFDRALIAAMDARVAEVERGWSRPGVELDARRLRADHADRATWMERTFARTYVPGHTWEDVLAAVTELERRVPR